MKHLPILLVCFFAMTSRGASVIGSPHDLSTKGFGTDNPCAVCHTPHNAQNTPGAPLWNHQTTAQTFTPYSSDTLVSKPGEPGPASKLCLSCHDGTIALDSFNQGGTMKAGTVFMAQNRQIAHGGTLGQEHPVAVQYDTALAQKNRALVTPASSKTVDGAGLLPLYNGMLECATCHDPHDNSLKNFLRVQTDKATLCVSCHIK